MDIIDEEENIIKKMNDSARVTTEIDVNQAWKHMQCRDEVDQENREEVD